MKSSKNSRTRLKRNSFGYQSLEDRKLMAVGAFTGVFDGNQITFDSGQTESINVGPLPDDA